MNKLKSGLLGMAVIALSAMTSCTQQGNVDLKNMDYEVKLDDENEKLSYAIGVNLATNFKQQGLDKLSMEAFIKAFNDVNADTTLLTLQECGTVIQTGLKKIADAKAEVAKAEGLAYLEENARKPGVTVTESGLQYEVLVEGDGPIPTASDKVEVHYHGTLTDGTVFDSSVDKGQTATFGVTQVIRGWVEALQLMPRGSKWKLTIPQDLAYGARGSGASIPPYATLVFEVELISIEGK